VSAYERLGEENGIRGAVDDFYRRVLDDPALTHYFEGVDVAGLRAHQAALLIQVTGGPARYDGRDMAAAHEGLGITPEDFDRVAGHLVATLQDAGVDPETTSEVATAVTSYRDDIVDQAHVAG
jgi:hemoglobin